MDSQIQVEYPIVSIFYHDIKGYGLNIYSYYKLDGFLNEIRNYSILLDRWKRCSHKRQIVLHTINLQEGLPSDKYLRQYKFRTNLALKGIEMSTIINTYPSEYKPSNFTINRVKRYLKDKDLLRSTTQAIVYEVDSDIGESDPGTPDFSDECQKISAMSIKNWYEFHPYYKSYLLPLKNDWAEYQSEDPSNKIKIISICHILSRLFDDSGGYIGIASEFYNIPYDRQLKSHAPARKYDGKQDLLSGDIHDNSRKLYRDDNKIDRSNGPSNTSHLESKPSQIESKSVKEAQANIDHLINIGFIKKGNYTVEEQILVLTVPIGHAYGDVIIGRNSCYNCITSGLQFGFCRLSRCCVDNKCYLNVIDDDKN